LRVRFRRPCAAGYDKIWLLNQRPHYGDLPKGYVDWIVPP
jgi:hypothetical protein